jgi:Outer membrane protein beta-barrel domain
MRSFKKCLLLIYLLIALSATNFSFAQKPTLGIKLGLALANATIDQTSSAPYAFSTLTKVGTLGGVFGRFYIDRDLIFQPDVEIVGEGYRETYMYSINGVPVRFAFLDVPLNIIYKKQSVHDAFFAGGGPVIGFPLNRSFIGYPLKTEFSINALLGYEIPIGFSLILNYSYGISNASKDHQYISKISNRYLGISVGYTF